MVGSVLFSWLFIALALYFLISDGYKLSNICIRHYGQIIQDLNNRRISSSLTFNQIEQDIKQNLERVGSFIDSLQTRLSLYKEQFINSFFVGIFIFLQQDNYYSIYLMLLVETVNLIKFIVQIKFRSLGLIQKTKRFIDAFVRIMNIALLIQIILLQILSDLDNSLDQLIYIQIITLFSLNLANALFSILDDIVNYKSYLVIEADDLQNFKIKNPFHGIKSKNVPKVLKKVNSNDLQIFNSQSFGKKMHISQSLSVIKSKKIKQQGTQFVNPIKSKKLGDLSCETIQSQLQTNKPRDKQTKAHEKLKPLNQEQTQKLKENLFWNPKINYDEKIKNEIEQNDQDQIQNTSQNIEQTKSIQSQKRFEQDNNNQIIGRQGEEYKERRNIFLDMEEIDESDLDYYEKLINEAHQKKNEQLAKIFNNDLNDSWNQNKG